MKRQNVIGSVALLGAAFLWATGYIAVKEMVTDIPPEELMTIRFAVSLIILLILYRKKIKQISKDLLKAGIAIGASLFVEFYTYTVALQYTKASRFSFIVASYIIILPLVYLIIRKKKPGKGDVLASCVCMAGIALIMGGDLGSFGPGDILSVICAVSYAVYIVLSAKHSKGYDIGLLNIIQILTTTVCSIAAMFITSGISALRQADSAQTAAALFTQPVRQIFSLTFMQWAGVVYLAVLCTVIPFFLCLYGMKNVSTTASGVLLSFESVIAAFLAVIMLHEALYWQLILGGIIVIFSFFLLSKITTSAEET